MLTFAPIAALFGIVLGFLLASPIISSKVTQNLMKTFRKDAVENIVNVFADLNNPLMSLFGLGLGTTFFIALLVKFIAPKYISRLFAVVINTFNIYSQ